MTFQGRMAVLACIVGVVLVATGLYVVRALQVRDANAVEAGAPGVAAPTGPRIVFRNTTIDDTNSEVAAVPLDDPGAARVYLGPVCDRVDVASSQPDEMVCLRTDRGVVTTFEQQIYRDGDLVSSWPLPGIPSRTRFSPSGDLVADTVFVSGHSYLQAGFSTATVIRETATGKSYGNLEKWAATVDGRPFDAVDRNLWGVTFVDDGSFYATLGSGEHTYLMKGDLATRTLVSLHDNAECPSVSPDHSRVAYKKRTGSGGHWSIAVLDLASGQETVLDETRSVDDQVAWLDDSTLLYGLPRIDEAGVSDIWRITITGGSPELFITNAWSPSVVT
jgi:hypothetical protein